MPAQSDGIQPVHPGGVSSGHTHERRNVLGHGAAAAYHRVGADSDVLMHAGKPADDRMIADCDVPCQAGCVRHDQMAAQTTVMRHMAIGHEKILVADRRDSAALHRRAIDGYILAENVVIPHYDLSRLALIPQMLRRPAHRHEGVEFATRTDLGPAFDVDMGEQTGSWSNGDMFSDNAKRSDAHVIGERGLGMDNGLWMNLHAGPPPRDDTSATGLRSSQPFSTPVTWPMDRHRRFCLPTPWP